MDLFLNFASCMNSNAGAIIIACVVAAVAFLLLVTLFAKANKKHHFIVWDSVDDNYYLD